MDLARGPRVSFGLELRCGLVVRLWRCEERFSREPLGCLHAERGVAGAAREPGPGFQVPSTVNTSQHVAFCGRGIVFGPC